MYPMLFKIGGVPIYTYGFFVFLGVLIGYLVAQRQARRQGFKRNIFTHIVFWVIIFSFIGARLFYIIVEFRSFLEASLSTLVGRSGFVFYGGIVFGSSTLLILCRRHKINFFKFVDTLSLGLPLGHAIGRIGCFFYGCCYGRPTRSFLGILFLPESPAGALGIKVIPTQLIESFFLFLIFFSLLIVSRRKKLEGQVFVLYLILYGIVRFVIEFYRGDPRGQILGLSTSQFFALAAIIFGFILWRKIRNLHIRKKTI
jgi:phosphatidylglycerol:prolipoprotein diacylglycerol transferase